jgi:excinuclease ABC subunit A
MCSGCSTSDDPQRGDTVVLVEHNTDVVRCSDWVVDLGPDGGDGGGQLVAEGPPEAIAANPLSHTGRFLRDAGVSERVPELAGAVRACCRLGVRARVAPMVAPQVARNAAPRHARADPRSLAIPRVHGPGSRRRDGPRRGLRLA